MDRSVPAVQPARARAGAGVTVCTVEHPPRNGTWLDVDRIVGGSMTGRGAAFWLAVGAGAAVWARRTAAGRRLMRAVTQPMRGESSEREYTYAEPAAFTPA